MDEFALMPDAQESVRRLRAAGLLVIVVTNQPDRTRGLISTETMRAMNRVLFSKLAINDIYICPHTAFDKCECRKPKPGLLLRASATWDIDLSRSFLVGDRDSDVEAGLAAGCTTVLLAPSSSRWRAHIVVPTLPEAVDRITALCLT
jgi:D-glycero-D-manno-heptose 1,7-bisphosphate phosphatase